MMKQGRAGAWVVGAQGPVPVYRKEEVNKEGGPVEDRPPSEN